MKKIIILFTLLFNIASYTYSNNRTYISVMHKLLQKNDFNTTLLDIAHIINTNENILNIDKVRKFIESENGKHLKELFNTALNPNQYSQIPLSAIGLFLYDFYRSNIFETSTEEIGEILEVYLLNYHNLSKVFNFKNIETVEDFILTHRLLYTKNYTDQTLKNTQDLVNIIRTTSLENLTDESYVENTLLPKLGFNNVNLYEFPSNLNEYYGKGFKLWEYPNQFAKYLVSLSKSSINSYLELHALNRGTFIIVTEYLKRFNPNLKSCIIDPNYSLIIDLYTNIINTDTEYILDFSSSKRFIDLSTTQWDLAFIDGDRSFQGITAQYNLIKNRSNIITLQDIVSSPCPGIVSLWGILKKVYYKKNRIDEFTDQYEEIMLKQNKKYMGIGVIYTNILK